MWSIPILVSDLTCEMTPREDGLGAWLGSRLSDLGLYPVPTERTMSG